MLRPLNPLTLALPPPPLGFTTCIFIFIHICVSFQFCNLGTTGYFLIGYSLLYAKPCLVRKCFYFNSVSIYTSAIFSSPYVEGAGEFSFSTPLLTPHNFQIPKRNLSAGMSCHIYCMHRVQPTKYCVR